MYLRCLIEEIKEFSVLKTFSAKYLIFIVFDVPL